MPSEYLYTATCPECGSVVAATTDAVPAADLNKSLSQWLQDGLRVERASLDAATQLNFHREGCSIGAEARKEGAA